MRGIEITAYTLADRYRGVREIRGPKHHPLIQWWLSLCKLEIDSPDEIPWCSAFVNGIAWELGLPRSESAAARSWLNVGTPVTEDQAARGFDIVVLQRGEGPQPGPGVLAAPGHVGLFDSFSGSLVTLLGGNQGDEVDLDSFPRSRILGIRRLWNF